MSSYHNPVLLHQSVDGLNIEERPDGVYIDATMGGAGHTKEILSRLGPNGRLTIEEVLAHLYTEHKQSLLVEGGAKTLQSFLDADCWDTIRVETAPIYLGEGIRAPQLPPHLQQVSRVEYDGRTITTYERPHE